MEGCSRKSAVMAGRKRELYKPYAGPPRRAPRVAGQVCLHWWGFYPTITLVSTPWRCGLGSLPLSFARYEPVTLLFHCGRLRALPLRLSVSDFRLPSLSGGLPSATHRATSTRGTGASRVASGFAAGLAAGFGLTTGRSAAGGFAAAVATTTVDPSPLA